MPQGVVDSTIWEGDGRAAGWAGCFEIVLAPPAKVQVGDEEQLQKLLDNSTDLTIDFATIIPHIYIYILDFFDALMMHFIILFHICDPQKETYVFETNLPPEDYAFPDPGGVILNLLIRFFLQGTCHIYIIYVVSKKMPTT